MVNLNSHGISLPKLGKMGEKIPTTTFLIPKERWKYYEHDHNLWKMLEYFVAQTEKKKKNYLDSNFPQVESKQLDDVIAQQLQS